MRILAAWELVLYPLELRFPPWDATRGAPDGIIVLGGAIEPDRSARMVRLPSSGAGRLIAAAHSPTGIRKRASCFPAAMAAWTLPMAREADYAAAFSRVSGFPKIA